LREADGIAPLWRFLTFTMNIGLDVAQTPAFSHAWSLCVEEHFYLLLPLILLVLDRRANVTTTVWIGSAIILVGAAIRFWLWESHVASALNSGDVLGATYGYMTYVYYPSWGRLDGLLFGVLLAASRIFLSTRPRLATPAVTGLAGAALVGVALWMFSHRGPAYLDVPNIVLSAWGAVVGLPLLGLGFALILSALLDLEPFLARLRNPVTSAVANLAFSLYLTHKLVLHAVSPLLEGRIPGGAAFSVCLAACFAVAGLLYLTVERPFLALRSRVQRKREPDEGVVLSPEGGLISGSEIEIRSGYKGA
jgi:peptidoglycan/LPS O-acetylase OafA/YrhL